MLIVNIKMWGILSQGEWAQKKGPEKIPDLF